MPALRPDRSAGAAGERELPDPGHDRIPIFTFAKSQPTMSFHSRAFLSRSLLLGALAVGSGRPAAGAEGTLADRISRLEEQLARIEARLDGVPPPAELTPVIKEFRDLSKQLGWDGKSPLTVVRAAGREQRLSVGGYAQIQGEFGDSPDARFNGVSDRFQLRRMRITVKGAFQENFEFTLQPEFGNNAISGVNGYRAQFADAFLAWTRYPAFNVQVGQFKTPFGYEQLLPDIRVPTVERSLPNDQLTVGRQIGIGLAGTLPKNAFSYSVGAFNGNGVNNGANDNDQFMFAGRLGATVWSRDADRLAFGVNGFTTRDTGVFVGRRHGGGVDAQLSLGRFDLQAELLRVRSGGLADGGSALVGWYFVPRALQAIVRYERFRADTAAANTTSDGWVFGVNYYVKGDDIKLAFNYHLGDPAGPLSNQGRFFSRLQVAF